MKVQMVHKISGTRDGVDWPAVGGVLVVGAVEGAELIANGFAVEAKSAPAPAVEKAVAPKAETRKGLTTKSI